MVHPRVSLHQVSTMSMTFADELALWDELSITQVGLIEDKLVQAGWQDATTSVRERRLTVSSMISAARLHLRDPESFARTRSELTMSIDRAVLVGAGIVQFATGAAGGATWEQLFDAFAEIVTPVVAYAEDRDVRLSIEPTSNLRADVGFVHTLADARYVAEQVGLGVIYDVANTWAERALTASLASLGDRAALTQVGDYVIGSYCVPDRVVPGEGDIPITELVCHLETSGFRGPYELELLGPRIDAEGGGSAARRGVAALSTIVAAGIEKASGSTGH